MAIVVKNFVKTKTEIYYLIESVSVDTITGVVDVTVKARNPYMRAGDLVTFQYKLDGESTYNDCFKYAIQELESFDEISLSDEWKTFKITWYAALDLGQAQAYDNVTISIQFQEQYQYFESDFGDVPDLYAFFPGADISIINGEIVVDDGSQTFTLQYTGEIGDRVEETVNIDFSDLFVVKFSRPFEISDENFYFSFISPETIVPCGLHFTVYVDDNEDFTSPITINSLTPGTSVWKYIEQTPTGDEVKDLESDGLPSLSKKVVKMYSPTLDALPNGTYYYKILVTDIINPIAGGESYVVPTGLADGFNFITNDGAIVIW